MKLELDLSNCPTKSGFKNATGLDTLEFPKKIDLVDLESDLDKLYIDK